VNNQEGSLANIIERSPLQSKKFIAFVISSMFTKAMIAYCIYKENTSLSTMLLIGSNAFLEIGYILGQAALDAYTRSLMGVAKSVRGK
jgi:hypothetical protein